MVSLNTDKAINAFKVAGTVAAGAVGAKFIGDKTGNIWIGTGVVFAVGVAGIAVKGSYGTYLAAGAILPPILNFVEDVVRKFV